MEEKELIKLFEKDFNNRSIKLCQKHDCGIRIAGIALLNTTFNLLSDELNDEQKIDVIVSYIKKYLENKDDKNAAEAVTHLLKLVKNENSARRNK